MNIFKSLSVETADGDFVEIRKPSVLKQEEIREEYSKLLRLCEKQHIADSTFSDAYFDNKKYRRQVNKVLKLAGIDPSVLSIDMIAQLLFIHEALDENGDKAVFFQGELIEWIFGPPGNDKEASSIKGVEVDNLANLMGEVYAFTNSFKETVDLLNTFDYEDLNKVLSARNEAMLPAEEKNKKKQAEASKKLIENMKKKTEQKVEKKEKTEMVELSEDEISKFI